MIIEIFVLLLLVLLNAFFSLSEMALVSSRKIKLKTEADKGKRGYRLAFRARESPSRYLSTIQIAITLIGILMGTVSGTSFSQWLARYLIQWHIAEKYAASLAVAVVVLAITVISVVVGELMPKSIALNNPEHIVGLTIQPMHALSVIFFPIVKILSSMTDGLMKLFGFSRHNETAITPEEVKLLIEQGEKSGMFEPAEREMVEEVLSLDDRRVTLFMTPRTEIVALYTEDAREDHIRSIIEHSEFAFLPVCENDLDHVKGMLEVKRALLHLAQGHFKGVESCMESPVVIPETFSGLKALEILRDAKKSTGLIIDEFGGISGLVTIGDLLEAVASFSKEQKDEVPEILRRSDGSYLVDGSMPIDEFSAQMGLEHNLIAPEDFDTVAGFVLHCAGSIPKVGDVIEYPPLRIEVVDMDGKRIDKVLVSRVQGLVDERY